MFEFSSVSKRMCNTTILLCKMGKFPKTCAKPGTWQPQCTVTIKESNHGHSCSATYILLPKKSKKRKYEIEKRHAKQNDRMRQVKTVVMRTAKCFISSFLCTYGFRTGSASDSLQTPCRHPNGIGGARQQVLCMDGAGPTDQYRPCVMDGCGWMAHTVQHAL